MGEKGEKQAIAGDIVQTADEYDDTVTVKELIDHLEHDGPKPLTKEKPAVEKKPEA